jgi:hypothetical protein
MAPATRRWASAATIVGLMVVSVPRLAHAQTPQSAPPFTRPSASEAGSIAGVVRDDRGQSVSGVAVTVVGATATVVVTDKAGRFEFGALAPGPYLLRAQQPGYPATRTQSVRVRPGARSTHTVSLPRRSTPTILAAGFAQAPADVEGQPPASGEPDAATEDQAETAWRIRHARRGVLKRVALPVEFLRGDHADPMRLVDLLERATGSPARLATNFFAETDFSGQLNLLTAASFETPQQLFSADSLPRNIAYIRLGAPVGSQADWTALGAVNQADISSWVVAGSYTTRAEARHRYDIGLSYSTQRYDGGNPLALRDLTDGSRNVGTVYGHDSFSVTPTLRLSYGGAYSQYDYLANRSLLSPRLELMVMPASGLRVTASMSRRALAPGAEEFLPPGDSGIWLPPQRTFSSLPSSGGLEAESTTHSELGVERDLGASTIGVRAFRQHVDDQLVTLFGVEIPGQPVAKLGHYVVGNVGDVEANGWIATFRTVLGSRVHGSVKYTLANAQMAPSGDLRYLVLLAPSTIRHSRERVHDLSTSVETEVPETATRVLVLYRVGNSFAREAGTGDSSTRPALDRRFDVQVRQSLPFMNFSNARWEMLLAVRNFFREVGSEQSVYDELLVVGPPKRLVGGVTLRF